MSRMTLLAAAADLDQVAELYQLDLPLPNIYFTSVSPFNGQTQHLYIAADFTGAAMAKLQVHCVETLGFRPMRSNSKVRFRRLKLGDLIDNPAAYEAALARSIAAKEWDVVARLEQLPEWIADKLGIGVPGAVEPDAAARLVAQLRRELNAAGL